MKKFLVVRNEKFVVTGVAENRKFQLILPRGKHFAMHAVKSGEVDIHFEDFLKKAVVRTKAEAFHIEPYGTINDYKLAERIVKNLDARTCSVRHRICMVPWSRRGEAHFRRRGTFKE